MIDPPYDKHIQPRGTETDWNQRPVTDAYGDISAYPLVN